MASVSRRTNRRSYEERDVREFLSKLRPLINELNNNGKCSWLTEQAVNYEIITAPQSI